MADRKKGGIRRRGVVLLATLVFIFMLTVIVTIFIQETEERIRYRAQTVGDRDLRRIAYNYLEYSEAILAEFRTFDDKLASASQGWGDPIRYATFPLDYQDLDVSVIIEDATDKLPLSLIDEEVFMVLMEALGIDAFDGARLRDGYFDWIDSDDEPRLQGAEARDYEIDRRYVVLPPNAPIKDLNELQYISGFYDWLDPSSRSYNPERFSILKRCITTIHNYPVNLNAAKPEVMEVLRLQEDMDIDAIQLYRAGDDRILGTPDDETLSESLPSQIQTALGENQKNLYGYEMKLCRIRIDIRRHEMAGFHLEALIDLGGGSGDSQIQPEPEQNPQQVPESSQENESNEEKPTKSNSKGFDVLVIRENFVESD